MLPGIRVGEGAAESLGAPRRETLRQRRLCRGPGVCRAVPVTDVTAAPHTGNTGGALGPDRHPRYLANVTLQVPG